MKSSIKMWGSRKNSTKVFQWTGLVWNEMLRDEVFHIYWSTWWGMRFQHSQLACCLQLGTFMKTLCSRKIWLRGSTSSCLVAAGTGVKRPGVRRVAACRTWPSQPGPSSWEEISFVTQNYTFSLIYLMCIMSKQVINIEWYWHHKLSPQL